MAKCIEHKQATPRYGFGSCSEIVLVGIDIPASTAGTQTSEPELPAYAYKRHYKSVTEDAVWWVVDHRNGHHEWTQRIRKVRNNE